MTQRADTSSSAGEQAVAAEDWRERGEQNGALLPRSVGPAVALVSSLLLLAATAFIARRLRRRLAVSG